MLQDDSNGETFEIIDKKTEELSLTADKAGRVSKRPNCHHVMSSIVYFRVFEQYVIVNIAFALAWRLFV